MSAGKLGIMANPGVAPLDPLTPVGQVRLNLGDTVYVPLDPPVEGQGDYNNFSDEAIEGFIAAASGNPASATGYGYLQLAAIAALSSGTITTDDLSVKQENRATELRQIAAAWFGRGDGADDAAGLNEYFNIVPYGGYVHPELSAFPTHWRY